MIDDNKRIFVLTFSVPLPLLDSIRRFFATEASMFRPSNVLLRKKEEDLKTTNQPYVISLFSAAKIKLQIDSQMYFWVQKVDIDDTGN